MFYCSLVFHKDSFLLLDNLLQFTWLSFVWTHVFNMFQSVLICTTYIQALLYCCLLQFYCFLCKGLFIFSIRTTFQLFTSIRFLLDGGVRCSSVFVVCYYLDVWTSLGINKVSIYLSIYPSSQPSSHPAITTQGPLASFSQIFQLYHYQQFSFSYDFNLYFQSFHLIIRSFLAIFCAWVHGIYQWFLVLLSASFTLFRDFQSF